MKYSQCIPFIFNLCLPYLDSNDKRKCRRLSTRICDVIDNSIMSAKVTKLFLDDSLAPLMPLVNLVSLRIPVNNKLIEQYMTSLTAFGRLKKLHLEVVDSSTCIYIDSKLLKRLYLDMLYIEKYEMSDSNTSSSICSNLAIEPEYGEVDVYGVHLDHIVFNGFTNITITNCNLGSVSYESSCNVALEFENIRDLSIWCDGFASPAVEGGAVASITGTFHQVFKMIRDLESSNIYKVTIRDSFLYDYSIDHILNSQLLSSKITKLTLCSVALPEELWPVLNIVTLTDLYIIDVITRADFMGGLSLPLLKNLVISLDELDLRFPYEMTLSTLTPMHAPMLENVNVTLEPQYSSIFPCTQLFMALLPPCSQLVFQTHGDVYISPDLRPISQIRGIEMRSRCTPSSDCNSWIIPLLSKLDALYIIGLSGLKIVLNSKTKIFIGHCKNARNTTKQHVDVSYETVHERPIAPREALSGIWLQSTGPIGHFERIDQCDLHDNDTSNSNSNSLMPKLSHKWYLQAENTTSKYVAIHMELIYNKTLHPRLLCPDVMDILWNNKPDTCVSSWLIRGLHVYRSELIMPTTIVLQSLSNATCLSAEICKGCVTIDLSAIKDFYNTLAVSNIRDTVFSLIFPNVKIIKLRDDQECHKEDLIRVFEKLVPSATQIDVNNVFCF